MPRDANVWLPTRVITAVEEVLPFRLSAEVSQRGVCPIRNLGYAVSNPVRISSSVMLVGTLCSRNFDHGSQTRAFPVPKWRLSANSITVRWAS